MRFRELERKQNLLAKARRGIGLDWGSEPIRMQCPALRRIAISIPCGKGRQFVVGNPIAPINRTSPSSSTNPGDSRATSRMAHQRHSRCRGSVTPRGATIAAKFYFWLPHPIYRRHEKPLHAFYLGEAVRQIESESEDPTATQRPGSSRRRPSRLPDLRLAGLSRGLVALCDVEEIDDDCEEEYRRTSRRACSW